jgi:phosphonoacetaldehyde hydrolase
MDIKLVIFDWAGTLVDFGCRAPLGAFVEAFAVAGLPITNEVARRPMGAHKRDHVREILGYPEIAARARADLRREPDEALVSEIYGAFTKRLLAALPSHAAPIPGAVETLRWLRERSIHTGSTTGYTRAMMDVLEPAARASGIAPEALVCSDETPQSRPAPWACFRLAERFGVFPMSRCVKVGDTPADMAEGRNAGMFSIAVSDTGNELGLSADEFSALAPGKRAALRAAAAARLRDAGAQTVLGSVSELPAWIEAQSR